MKKLFSCRYGSHLYGTSTPESDIDLKHVVLPDLSSLLLGRTPKNVVKKTNINENQKNTADDIDEEFVPIHVFARDFLRGQTYALELAYAVDGREADQHLYDVRFLRFCKELRERFLTKDLKALVGHSVNQAVLYSQKGERLNVCRTTLEVYRKFPADDRIADHSVGFNSCMALVRDLYPTHVAVTTYDSDGRGKIAPCVMLLEKTLPYSSTFRYSIHQIQSMIDGYGSRVADAARDGSDLKALSHSLRIVEEGITLMRGNGLSFPRPPESILHLLKIRRGEIPYDEVIADINEKLATLQELGKASTLPENSPELRGDLEAFLLDWLEVFYTDDLFEIVRRNASAVWAPGAPHV
jgi:hypothetical protein